MAVDPLAWLDDALADLDRRGLRRTLLERAGPQRGDRIEIAGQTLLNFGSNDYLGMAAEPVVIEAARQSLLQVGWGAGASPLVTGRGTIHAQLERELARFEGTEAALLFPSGFAANVGAIAALAGAGDAIFSDAKNHASIIDGCRLSGATVLIYRHRDVAHLQELLADGSAKYRRRLIATDSLFSMDGDFAPLVELAELARKHEAMLLVDEAHATGVIGAGGRGVCEWLGVEEDISARVGTLSKALGSSGGFVAGSRQLIDWLANRARPYVFSTAAPEAAAAAALQSLQLVRSEPQRRQTLLALAAEFREQLSSGGYTIGDSQSQIVPIVLGDPNRTMQVAQALRERGMFVPGIRPPSVPAGESLLRVSLTYLHRREHVEQLLASLRDLC
jgi:8-amino-7-oxononanoate synthase